MSENSEKIEVEERGTKIVVNGKMEIERVELNDELSKEEQETAVKDCFNGAMKKMQMIVAQKMQSLR